MNYHKPVLTAEVLSYLAPRPGGIYIDATFGGGGHSRAILEAESGAKVIAVDWDSTALDMNGPALLEEFPDRISFLWANFAHITRKLKERDITKVDGILADFGTSQYQIHAKAGFSFNQDTPLDMRMSLAHKKVTARDILNYATVSELEHIFFEFGQESAGKKVALAISQQRMIQPLETTAQLAKLVEKIIPKRGGIHPATKVFQALRIFINDEFNNIHGFLKSAVPLLNSGGRLVCISFHSLEDRIVKQYFRDLAQGPQACLTVLTPKVVRATEAEVAANNASRSACLRAAQKK